MWASRGQRAHSYGSECARSRSVRKSVFASLSQHAGVGATGTEPATTRLAVWALANLRGSLWTRRWVFGSRSGLGAYDEGSFKGGDAGEVPRRMASWVMRANKRSAKLSQEALVGVRWKWWVVFAQGQSYPRGNPGSRRSHRRRGSSPRASGSRRAPSSRSCPYRWRPRSARSCRSYRGHRRTRLR